MTTPRRTLSFRMGAGALGLLLGLPIGLAVALVGYAFPHVVNISLAGWIFSTSGALATASFLFPDAALAALPWIAYFFLGAIPNAQNWKKHSNLLPDRRIPSRLRSAFQIGVVASIIFAGLISYLAQTSP